MLGYKVVLQVPALTISAAALCAGVRLVLCESIRKRHTCCVSRH